MIEPTKEELERQKRDFFAGWKQMTGQDMESTTTTFKRGYSLTGEQVLSGQFAHQLELLSVYCSYWGNDPDYVFYRDHVDNMIYVVDKTIPVTVGIVSGQFWDNQPNALDVVWQKIKEYESAEVDDE